MSEEKLIEEVSWPEPRVIDVGDFLLKISSKENEYVLEIVSPTGETWWNFRNKDWRFLDSNSTINGIAEILLTQKVVPSLAKGRREWRRHYPTVQREVEEYQKQWKKAAIAMAQQEAQQGASRDEMSAELRAKVENKLDNYDVLTAMAEPVFKVHVKEEAAIVTHFLSGLSPSLGERSKITPCQTVGGSSKGKSAVQEHVGLCFSDIVVVTSSSAKAVIYASEAGRITDGMILMFDESEASSEMAMIERSIVDQKAIPPKHWTVNDKRKFQEMVLDKNVAVWRNSVNTTPDQQLNSRYLTMNIDESPEQDQRVFNQQVRQEFLEKPDWQLSRALTKTLKSEPVSVTIPFLPWIKSAKGIGNRRSFKKWKNLIRSCTSAYRHQRPRDGSHILSSRADAEIVSLLWKKLAQHEASALSTADLTAFEVLKTAPYGTGWDIKHIAKWLGIETDTAYKRLERLCDKGLASRQKRWCDDDRTNKVFYWADSTRLGMGLEIEIDWDGYAEAVEKAKETGSLQKDGLGLSDLTGFSVQKGDVFDTLIETQSTAKTQQIISGKVEKPEDGELPKASEQRENSRDNDSMDSEKTNAKCRKVIPSPVIITKEVK